MGRRLIVNFATVGSVLFLGASVFGIGAHASGDAIKAPAQHWSFQGLFGTFDRGALQRGFQVYNEVCAGCHSLRLVAYRNLADIGFTEDQIAQIAAEKDVTDGPNDEGEMFDRPAKASDRFVSPFPNENAARAANNGAFPPDLSLIIKARKDGANYLHALMVGYKEPPAGTTMPEGMAYNEYFPGSQIAMPAPISEDAVEYADKTKATVAQMASDVTTFLAWAGEPELEARKRMGVKVLLFLVVLTGLLYAVKRRIWSDVR
ncbi:cytochrome c1 [Alphaproteobacteria bacterium]|nr:cytochrome c1 [Alphaproteobacteria bacterium]